MCGFDRFDTTGQQDRDLGGGQHREREREDEPAGARGESCREGPGPGAWSLGAWGVGRCWWWTLEGFIDYVYLHPSRDMGALGAARAEVRCSRSDGLECRWEAPHARGGFM